MMYDPRNQKTILVGKETLDMSGMSDRDKRQQEKRDRLHESALRREEERRQRERDQKTAERKKK
jgi:hypothetical protein